MSRLAHPRFVLLIAVPTFLVWMVLASMHLSLIAHGRLDLHEVLAMAGRLVILLPLAMYFGIVTCTKWLGIVCGTAIAVWLLLRR